MHQFRARTISRAAIAACIAALTAGCGRDVAPPEGCAAGDQPLMAALRSAPGPVRIGDARLSDCLQHGASGDQVQAVGASFVDAASGLAARARRRPESRAALELGYLVAAAHRGGAHTQGVHDELLRRLDQELATVDTHARAYRRGRRAGARTG